MKVDRIEIKDMGRGRKVATATLRYLTDVVTVKLDLVSVDGRWRVADIRTKDMPSLVGFLEDSLRREAAEAKSPR
jgi:hypothetical protein